MWSASNSHHIALGNTKLSCIMWRVCVVVQLACLGFKSKQCDPNCPRLDATPMSKTIPVLLGPQHCCGGAHGPSTLWAAGGAWGGSPKRPPLGWLTSATTWAAACLWPSLNCWRCSSEVWNGRQTPQAFVTIPCRQACWELHGNLGMLWTLTTGQRPIRERCEWQTVFGSKKVPMAEVLTRGWGDWTRFAFGRAKRIVGQNHWVQFAPGWGTSWLVVSFWLVANTFDRRCGCLGKKTEENITKKGNTK